MRIHRLVYAFFHVCNKRRKDGMKMQGKKKICAIFTTVILFLSGFIYVTRFDVREGLCAEAGTDIEYILNENNLHDYINVSRVFDKYLTIDSTGVHTRRSGEYTIKVINRITGD